MLFIEKTPDKVKRRLAKPRASGGHGSFSYHGLESISARVKSISSSTQLTMWDHHNRTWDARHKERTADAMTFSLIAWTISVKEPER